MEVGTKLTSELDVMKIFPVRATLKQRRLATFRKFFLQILGSYFFIMTQRKNFFIPMTSFFLKTLLLGFFKAKMQIFL